MSSIHGNSKIMRYRVQEISWKALQPTVYASLWAAKIVSETVLANSTINWPGFLKQCCINLPGAVMGCKVQL
jgi:hypothetical protein